MLNFTPEQLEAVKAAKSAEELIEIAKRENIELTQEQAEKFSQPPVGELSEEELGNVAGGACAGGDRGELSYQEVTPQTECNHGFLSDMQAVSANIETGESWTSSFPRRCHECSYMSSENGKYYCTYKMIFKGNPVF